MDLVIALTLLVLSGVVGVEVISKVTSTLHTPLMSGTNAISGMVLIGAVLVTAHTDSTIGLVAGLLAIVLSAVNLVGGFLVTDRMLQMFTTKKEIQK
ncbi:NAD(P) transhydrogenase subunit alpha [Tessaracoccus caeni]|uniref:NAD(P) transhydrogenase subunit alpha n=1 Tax=Tessaracoccus caeni TaxID=3031239 RepID=UPI0023DC52DD|nr:NAD(P) transhydrogenase subunit alpha [Tessaracoccus caeni]MDF1489556.1 NAD(P) transhydrogenase subunit alpha [Tessaracoccus caeni]